MGRALSEDQKEKARQRARIWALNNKEKLAQYRATHKTSHALYMKVWRDVNREQVKAYKNAHAKKPSSVKHKRQYDRARYLENTEAIKSAVRDYNNANPEKKRAWRLVRAERSKNASGHASASQIRARIDYFGRRCAYCGGPFEHLDHVVPLSRGGTNWPANLRPACAACNLSKNAMNFKDWQNEHPTKSGTEGR